MANFKRIDRKYVHSDNSINVYGFRLLTSGYLIDEYLKNPIGYYNHYDKDGVLVRWEDVKIEGDKITGYPVINKSHPRGWQSIEEVESNFLNGASVGDIVILEYTFEDNPADPETPILVGTKWYNKETSLCDKPGNRGPIGEGGAFAEPVRLFDAAGLPLNLSDLTNKKISLMEKVTLPITPEVIAMLGLSDADAKDDKRILGKLKDLSDKAASAQRLADENVNLKADKATLNAEKEKAVKDLSDYKKTEEEAKVKAMLDEGLEKNMLTKDLADTLGKDYATNPAGLKTILDKMSPYASLADKIANGNADKKVPEKFLNKSLMDLQKEDLLEEVKNSYPDLYDTLKKEHAKNK